MTPDTAPNRDQDRITDSAAPLTPDELHTALAEVGRIIESMPPSERKLGVSQFVASMTEAEQRDFLVGVFIWAHEQGACR